MRIIIARQLSQLLAFSAFRLLPKTKHFLVPIGQGTATHKRRAPRLRGARRRRTNDKATGAIVATETNGKSYDLTM
jgi:hypothetical protein